MQWEYVITRHLIIEDLSAKSLSAGGPGNAAYVAVLCRVLCHVISDVL